MSQTKRAIGFKPNHQTDEEPIPRATHWKLNQFKLAFNEFLYDTNDGVDEAKANQTLFDRIRTIQKQ